MKRFTAVMLMCALMLQGTVLAQPMYGDANNDSILTADDAAMVLQKVLDSSYQTPLEASQEDYIKILDVDNSGTLTSTDAAFILQKVLDSSLIMPIEREQGTETSTEAVTDEATETTTETVTDKATETTTETVTDEATETTTTEIVTYTSDIVLEDYAITVNGLSESNGGVIIDNVSNNITITNGGTYNISGVLTNGQIIVDADSDSELNLNGVNISNSNGPAIYGLNGDMDISAKKGTENFLSDGTPTEVDADGEPDACIFSSDGIKLKGTGSLTVNGNYSRGITGKDEVIIQKLSLTVNSVDDCIKAKDYITVTSGTLNLTSETSGDGIKCTKGDITINDGNIAVKAVNNGVHAKAGSIFVNGGTINVDMTADSYDTAAYDYDGFKAAVDVVIGAGTVVVTSYCDGIQATGTVTIAENADVDVTTVGEISSSSTSSNGFPSWGMDWGSTTEDSDISSKGIKGETAVNIAGGSITVNSSDDSVHSDGDITVDGGTLLLSSGDDGIHADVTLTINDGSINVEKSYEGIEAANIYVNGGTVRIFADDDSVNAAGGNDSSGSGGYNTSSTGYLEINGGYLYCNNTKDGDGLDSNGKIVVNGGETIVNGPTSNGNGAIDYGDGSGDYMAFNGGKLIAGGSSGMAAYPSAGYSDANVIYYGGQSSNTGGNKFPGSQSSGSSSSFAANTLITLADKDGNVVLAYKPDRTVSSVIFADDTIKTGEKYTLYTGGTYTGSLNDDGYGTGGTISGGTSKGSVTVSSKLSKIS